MVDYLTSDDVAASSCREAEEKWAERMRDEGATPNEGTSRASENNLGRYIVTGYIEVPDVEVMERLDKSLLEERVGQRFGGDAYCREMLVTERGVPMKLWLHVGGTSESEAKVNARGVLDGNVEVTGFSTPQDEQDGYYLPCHIVVPIGDALDEYPRRQLKAGVPDGLESVVLPDEIER